MCIMDRICIKIIYLLKRFNIVRNGLTKTTEDFINKANNM